MSEASADRPNLADLVARIERQQAEIRTFVAERETLFAEAETVRRERVLAPVLALVATLGAIAALAPTILRSWGV